MRLVLGLHFGKYRLLDYQLVNRKYNLTCAQKVTGRLFYRAYRYGTKRDDGKPERKPLLSSPESVRQSDGEEFYSLQQLKQHRLLLQLYCIFGVANEFFSSETMDIFFSRKTLMSLDGHVARQKCYTLEISTCNL